MKRLREVLLVVLLLVLLDGLILSGALVVPTFQVAFGWIFSGIRLAQQADISWGVAWWLAGLFAFVLLLYWFCSGFGHKRARLRAVAALTGLFLCVILAGMSLAGSVHQAAWLATSKEPSFGSDLSGPRGALRYAARGAERMLEHFPDRKKWENAWRGENPLFETARIRDFHSAFATHLRVGRHDEVEEVAVWPRNGDDFQKFGGWIVQGRKEKKNVTREELLAYLEKQPAVPHGP